MTTSETPTPGAIAEQADAEQRCDVCSHPWAAHDELGVRFCTATKGSCLSRGCICRSNVDIPVARRVYGS